ncbi:MAG TPA: biotin synthase BioB [Candidatus Acidoferrum sp.]|nr:biotin synthase BioB [Candidatus Acidoferrum sp.]HKS82890.1 biotin synthase BioB [Candidatus Acidoferrales bacterium]
MQLRHNWTRDEIRSVFNLPLPELIFRAQLAHREFHKPEEVQLCRLLSIKTGACPEDCAYCSQSAHYKTPVARQKLMDPADVLASAQRAKADGATRFCMGAAWRDIPEGKEFDAVLEMVRSVAALDLEVCCTLGMLTDSQAARLKHAGLTAYNHNLDTSPEFYGHIITTRVYEDRLATIARVRKAGITVCCGGILGLGESDEDRIGLLHQLATLNPHPESVPINVLARVDGTPLANTPELDPMIMVRAIATARILMPASRVRLSGGRHKLSREAIALCFLAGANSIFTGEKLLTTPNPSIDKDKALLDELGMKAMQHHA